MPQINGFLDLMDERSFGSVWFWLVLLIVWTRQSRDLLGVPPDAVTRAQQDPTGQPGLALLDWLTLTLPRWRLGRRAGGVILGLGGFLLSSLALLGFGYGQELAQALTLLALPLVILFPLRLRLAQRLSPVIQGAHDATLTPGQAVTESLRMIVRYRRIAFALSIIGVAVTAFWGTIWQILHPNGL